MEFNFISVNHVQQFDFWIDKFIDVIGIIATGSIAWFLYKAQQNEERLKEDYLSLRSVYDNVIINMEYAFSFLNKANKSMEEVNERIKDLKELKYYFDCGKGVKELDLKISLPNNQVKNDYIKEKIDKIANQFICKEIFIKIIGGFYCKSNKEESLLLGKWGDVYYRKLYLSLYSYYDKTDEIIGILNKLLNEKTIRAEKMCEVPLCSFDNYQEELEHKIQEFLFIQDYYKQLQYCLERIMICSDSILMRLEKFNAKYVKKYKKILKSLKIEAYSLEIVEKLYDLEKLECYADFAKKNSDMLIIPKYKMLDLNWWEGLKKN